MTNKHRHHRRSIRLRHYDYASPGAYFVTICTHQRACVLGEIVNGAMVLNDFGRMVDVAWNAIPEQYPQVALDQYVIMPNHVHGLLVFRGGESGGEETRGGETRGGETPPLRVVRLGQVVAYFKYQSTKHINGLRGTPGVTVWQRNYYERIVRDDNELTRAREYIINNPLQWQIDKDNPSNWP